MSAGCVNRQMFANTLAVSTLTIKVINYRVTKHDCCDNSLLRPYVANILKQLQSLQALTLEVLKLKTFVSAYLYSI